MTLLRTSLAGVALLAVTGTALAADSRQATMGGTDRLAPGGRLELVAKRRAGRLRVRIRYTVTVTKTTVLGFAAYPCRSTSCDRSSVSRIKLEPGTRRVTFSGHVPVVERADGTACVYAQLRDRGKRGRGRGTVVRRGRYKGVVLCRKA